jgi:hypothetical protein
MSFAPLRGQLLSRHLVPRVARFPPFGGTASSGARRKKSSRRAQKLPVSNTKKNIQFLFFFSFFVSFVFFVVQ